MTEPIPLSAALCIQKVGIIVDDVLDDFFDGMLETFTAKGWWVGDVQRET